MPRGAVAAHAAAAATGGKGGKGMTQQDEPKEAGGVGRRRVIGMAVASAGALGAAMIGGSPARANHLSTQVNAFSDNGEPAVNAINSSGGPAVAGKSGSGWGVVGDTNSNAFAAVEGHNANAGFNAAGVRGTSAGNGMGVDGQTVNGKGVSGTSENGIGVSAGSLNGVAFEAFAPSGEAAIRVTGKARFSHLAWNTVPSGQHSVFVPHFAVTATSHITVTLTSDPAGASLQWIERVPGSGFRVHLTKAVKTATTFSYFIAYPFSG
jgi:hypothetical protein